MKLEFESLEECVRFADSVRVTGTPTGYGKSSTGYTMAEIAESLARVAMNRDKIHAIKVFRAMFGTSVTDSKNVIDRYWN